MLACFPAGRDDPANRGRFVLQLSRSGINHILALTTTRIRGERFLETCHSAVIQTSGYGGGNRGCHFDVPGIEGRKPRDENVDITSAINPWRPCD